MPKYLLLILTSLWLTACAEITVKEYRDFEPALNVERFFEGYLTAHGIIKNGSGKVIRTFNADIQASWKDDIGTLVEKFVFDDGELQYRTWTLTPDEKGSYTGTAEDVVGEATMSGAGNSLFFEYVLRIPYGDSTVDVTVDDRMYLVTPDVLINESTMTKFGWQVGSIDLVIIRR